MAIFYADTSALVKRYQPEKGSEFINALYDRIAELEERLLTSQFSLVEFGSAIMRLHREKVFSHEEALGLLGLFRRESESLLGFWPITQLVLYESLRLVIDYFLKPPDALQLASALEARSFYPFHENDFYFVADDEALCKAARNEGLHVLNPRHSAAMNQLKSLGHE